MTGRCLCGAVTFTAEGVEIDHSACHCGMCRRWAGGSPFFSVRTKSVTFTGAEHITRFDSSEWAQRGFCSRCGTALFWYLKPKNAYAMSVGAFDDPSPFQVAIEIFIDRKPPGYELAGEHPRLTEAETFAKLRPRSQ